MWSEGEIESWDHNCSIFAFVSESSVRSWTLRALRVFVVRSYIDNRRMRISSALV
jgi:hypothetical protein